MSYRKCPLCKRGIKQIDYRASGILSHFITSWAKIKTNRDTAACSKHQRYLSQAIKRARFMALLPYISR